MLRRLFHSCSALKVYNVYNIYIMSDSKNKKSCTFIYHAKIHFLRNPKKWVSAMAQELFLDCMSKKEERKLGN